MAGASARRRLMWIERLLVLVGVVCLSYYGYASVSAAVFQREQRQQFEEMRAAAAESEASPTNAVAMEKDPTRPSREQADESIAPPPTRAGDLVGMLEVPRLGIATPVVWGDDEKLLDVAVGLLPDTPLPWEPGNSAVAAHRDGLFRPLRRVRVGDRVIVRTARGDLEYEVRRTRIVEPTDLSVLEPLDADALTLITCYPFNFVGSAPQRFVVHAIRTSGSTLAADGMLPSRSLVSVAPYSRATAAPPVVRPAATAATTLAATRAAAGSTRVSGAKKPPTSRIRAAKRADTKSVRDKRARAAAPAASSKSKAGDDDRPKKRRWYHIFTGR
jgi:sortase A